MQYHLQQNFSKRKMSLNRLLARSSFTNWVPDNGLIYNGTMSTLRRRVPQNTLPLSHSGQPKPPTIHKFLKLNLLKSHECLIFFPMKICMRWIVDEGTWEIFQKFLNNHLLQLISVILAVETIQTHAHIVIILFILSEAEVHILCQYPFITKAQNDLSLK